MEKRRLQSLRKGGELENHLVDEYAAGRMSRRELLRRGTVLGLSLPVLGSVLGPELAGATPRPAAGRAVPGAAGGGTVRVGIVTPAGAIDPLTVEDQGGLDMLGQTGEYLCLSDQQLRLRPVLATSWSANSSATVWTFKIREGVKFHNGAPLTADDVVYTYQLHANPKNGSEALSAFAGVLSDSGVVKVDDYTVAFHLEAPNGNFPYLCSSDNYNMIILPKGYNPKSWQSSFVGTGPWVMQTYQTDVGATFTRNDAYWGPKAKPAAAHFTFFATPAPSVLALQSGSIDVLGQFAVSGGEALLHGGYNIINLRSSAHRELSMRCDQKPFDDPRVRQAVALSLNRTGIISALFQGYAVAGNDSPFAPVFPSTVKLPQRNIDVDKAKSLLAAAGYPKGFSTTLYTENFLEIPELADYIQQGAAAIGVNITTQVLNQSEYYSKYWLTGTMSLVDYGSRGIPNVFLTAPLTSTGPWNAAHFKNAGYDSLVKQYVAAVDLSSQRAVARKIETLLLAETPIVYPYFYNYLSATGKNVTGAYPTAIGHIFVNNVTIS
jgi:peptide/nickel transport system substrate-binding protein